MGGLSTHHFRNIREQLFEVKSYLEKNKQHLIAHEVDVNINRVNVAEQNLEEIQKGKNSILDVLKD